MSQVDTFSLYVRQRLEQWGGEFALHRDCDYLGHSSVNLLHVLMQHHGMPGKATGYKPLETNAEAQQVEDIITEIARHAPGMGWVMRAYYCGKGRRKVERYETANLLLANARIPLVTQPSYMDMVRRGTERVHGMLLQVAQAA